MPHFRHDGFLSWTRFVLQRQNGLPCATLPAVIACLGPFICSELMTELSKASVLVSGIITADTESVWQIVARFTNIQDYTLPTGGQRLASKLLVRTCERLKADPAN